MAITYNYEIVSVDESAGVMEIIYTADGKPTQHIGARLPYENEDLESVVSVFAPIAVWEESSKVYAVPSVGASGSLASEVAVITEEDQVRNIRNFKLAESDWRVLVSVEMNESLPIEWKLYRQELRDISNQEGFPSKVEWPIEPTI
jgi:hypothetical protein